MDAYAPYLLPFARDRLSSPLVDPPTCPLDEERLLRRSARLNDEDWLSLAAAFTKATGLALIWEKPARYRVLRKSGEANSPKRYLVLQSDLGTWFVLEHPEGLEQFDRLAGEEEKPALAKPSLFLEWFTLPENREGSPLSGTSPSLSRPDNQAAFDKHLADLLTAGSPSDWHLEPMPDRYRSRLRIHGRLTPERFLSCERGRWLINSVISRARLGEKRPGTLLEGRFDLVLPSHQTQPVRVSLIPSLHGYSLTARFLPHGDSLPGDLESLGLSKPHGEHLRNALMEKDGLWLIAGPTGSGKSTTLHACLHLAARQSEKVLAVEDPVERLIPGVQHVQVGLPRGLTFAVAVRAFLRQAPDCLLVGEIRDPETAAIALQAARTGHRVLSSIHSRDTRGVIRRMNDLKQSFAQMAPVLKILIHQRLIPLLCGNCKIIRRHHRAPARSKVLGDIPEYAESRGCEACQSGYAARTGLFAVGKADLDWPCQRELRDGAVKLLREGRIDLPTVLPFLSPGERQKLRFAICKDFVNYHPQ